MEIVNKITVFMNWDLSRNRTNPWEQITAGIKKLVVVAYEASDKNAKKDGQYLLRLVG